MEWTQVSVWARDCRGERRPPGPQGNKGHHSLPTRTPTPSDPSPTPSRDGKDPPERLPSSTHPSPRTTINERGIPEGRRSLTEGPARPPGRLRSEGGVPPGGPVRPSPGRGASGGEDRPRYRRQGGVQAESAPVRLVGDGTHHPRVTTPRARPGPHQTPEPVGTEDGSGRREWMVMLWVTDGCGRRTKRVVDGQTDVFESHHRWKD